MIDIASNDVGYARATHEIISVNFDHLERIVGLLERAATAMTTIAALEKDGQLKKISEALK